jgi:hypothetical protein
MKTKRVLRYFCDHCSKGSLSRHSMTLHENICFRNPLRFCFLCEKAKPVEELKATIQGRDIAALRVAAYDCPACILAAIIQLVPKGQRDEESTWYEFDYKKEKEAYISDQNDASISLSEYEH